MGHGRDIHLTGFSVDGENDHGLATCRNGAQPGGDLVPPLPMPRRPLGPVPTHLELHSLVDREII